MKRYWTVDEWRDGQLLVPPLAQVETLAEVEKAFADEIAKNPNRRLVSRQGARVVHKHPDTNWEVFPSLMPIYAMQAKPE